MKRKIRFSAQSEEEWIGDLQVSRLITSQFIRAVGPFVLFEHITSVTRLNNESEKKILGSCAQPHRGVGTLTYIINGEVNYVDSLGNNTRLGPGAAHWLKAGRGIVHEEMINPEYPGVPNISIFRFWINLPSKQKSDDPEYFAIDPDQIPKIILVNDAGWVKIVSGKYENVVAKVPCKLKQFLYHIHMNAGKQFSTSADIDWECAAFIASNSAVINDKEFQAGEFIVFDMQGEIVEIKNFSKRGMDIILLGGEPYTEPIVADGNFVMNNAHEITQAYNDYYDGKYGVIPGDEDRE
jgi:redox-sensitive bicupin YhaK (pirin superfamily)